MNHRLSVIIGFLLVACVSENVLGQEYFPLRVGNKWVYRELNWSYEMPAMPADTIVVAITADSVFEDGLRWYKFHGYAAGRAQWVRASGDTIFYLRPDSSIAVPFYRTNVLPGTTWDIRYFGLFTAKIFELGTVSPFGHPTNTIEYWYDGLEQMRIVLSRDYGPVIVWYLFDPPGAYNTSHVLIGAVLSDTVYGTIVSVASDHESPSQFTLRQNYPNPFNPSTRIQFDLPRTSKVNLSVFDVLGRHLETVVDATLDPGPHVYTWTGATCPTGVYVYRLESESFFQSRVMILAK